VSELEQELRAALANPPVDEDYLADFSPLAALQDRIAAHVRRRRIAVSAATVVAVIAVGTVGIRALDAPNSLKSAQSIAGGHVPADTDTDARAGGGGANGPGVAPPAAASARGVPPEVLAAARQALTKVVNGKPAGVLRWAPSGREYLVQIPLATTTMCKVCRDPGGIPESGAVIELRVPIMPTRSGGTAVAPVPTTAPGTPYSSPPGSGAPGDPPKQPPGGYAFPGYRLLTTAAATDFNTLAGARQAAFVG
jgi:hypothetical protein